MASQTEDRLLEVLKAVGARVDSAVGTFTNLSSFGRVEQSEVGQSPNVQCLFHLCTTRSHQHELLQPEAVQCIVHPTKQL